LPFGRALKNFFSLNRRIWSSGLNKKGGDSQLCVLALRPHDGENKFAGRFPIFYLENCLSNGFVGQDTAENEPDLVGVRTALGLIAGTKKRTHYDLYPNEYKKSGKNQQGRAKT
jgi:hypothetical protein